MKNVLLKKIIMTILILIMTATVVLSLSTDVFAAGKKPSKSGSSTGMPTIGEIEGAGDDGTANTMGNIVGAVLYIIKIAAVGTALIMLAVLAMKYMSSAPSDRATIKKHAVVYVVGACVLFGAAGILNIIENFATQNIPD